MNYKVKSDILKINWQRLLIVVISNWVHNQLGIGSIIGIWELWYDIVSKRIKIIAILVGEKRG